MRKVLMVASLLVLIYACSPRVAVDKNNQVDFNKYKTFAWMDSDVRAGQNPIYYNQIASESVENTMNGVLSEKGLQQVNAKPDLLVGYHFFVENKTRTVSAPMSPFYGPYLGWGRWGYAGWGPGWWGWAGGAGLDHSTEKNSTKRARSLLIWWMRARESWYGAVR